jgi:hypothetical protein
VLCVLSILDVLVGLVYVVADAFFFSSSILSVYANAE